MRFGQTGVMQRVALVIAVVVVALVAGGVFWWRARGVESTSAAGLLSVTSSPSGAAVMVEGKEVGRTPYFSDNRWGGSVAIEVSAPGYRKWSGTFEGGRDAKVEVTLARKKLRKVTQVDAGVIELDLDEEEEAPRHTKGPLRPPEPTEFVDDDLDREAEAQKKQ